MNITHHPRSAFYKTKRWALTRRSVLMRDEFTCAQCQRWGDQVDHLVPLAEGGEPYDLNNLQTLCSSCHGKKTRQEVQNRS